MQLDGEHLIDVLRDKINTLAADTAIVGIHTGGVWVAERLQAMLGGKHLLGSLAVTLHRDDFASIGLHPQKKSTEMPFSVEGRHVLLVDDVIHTGRTLRAALNELFDFGRPASVKLACLVDRGGRELPFHADFVGMTMDLDSDQELTLMQTPPDDKLRFDIKPKTRLQPES
jgi:pyrimidine operon attenuation protein / uracil phosphoribosyltransferase